MLRDRKFRASKSSQGFPAKGHIENANTERKKGLQGKEVDRAYIDLQIASAFAEAAKARSIVENEMPVTGYGQSIPAVLRRAADLEAQIRGACL